MFVNVVRDFCKGFACTLAFLDLVGSVGFVDGISMQPCLNPEENTSQDIVYLSKWCNTKFEYKRGEIVTLMDPKDPSVRIVKRIIGLEGDYIRTINYEQRYLEVPKGHCWLEGDNTKNSYDSNNFGPVSLGLITAKAIVIIWPPSRWRKIDSEVPYARSEYLNLKVTS